MRHLAHRLASTAITATLCVGLVAIAMASPAAAERKAPPAVRHAVQRVALKQCKKGNPSSCQKTGVKVSTVNHDFAYGGAAGDGVAAVLAHRSHGHWKVRGVQGGGVQSCGYWRKRAPEPVLSDLKIKGATHHGSNYGQC